MDIKDLVQNLKEEIQVKKIEKTASEQNQQNIADVDLSDLGIEVISANKISNSLEKIAHSLNSINSMDSLIKVAEEAGNTDLAHIVKIAETIGDKIADRIIAKLNNV